MTDDELIARMKVKVPEGRSGKLEVKHFSLTERQALNPLQQLRYGVGRLTRPGEYTKLVEWAETVEGNEEEIIWMSDTDAETTDHLEVMRRASDPSVRRVLVNGLGLGIVLTGLRSFSHIERIDVVEASADVIALVTPRKDPRVHITQGDAYLIKWDKALCWDLVWHDIWPHISTENLPGMWRLVQKYQHRAGWQGVWVFDLCCRQWAEANAWMQIVIASEGKEPGPKHPLYDTNKALKKERRAAMSIIGAGVS